jgi:glutamate synthase domain-containing protein 2
MPGQKSLPFTARVVVRSRHGSAASNNDRVPVAKVLGATHGRAKAFRPTSVITVSAMSYGALSSNAISALNQGAKIAGCLHTTGEGGTSPHHQQGGELIWQLGSGYFAARDTTGRFDLERLCATVSANPVRAIEIELSQGAKPGLGGCSGIEDHPGDQQHPRDPRGR